MILSIYGKGLRCVSRRYIDLLGPVPLCRVLATVHRVRACNGGASKIERDKQGLDILEAFYSTNVGHNSSNRFVQWSSRMDHRAQI